jgi:putative ABC transport system permease protein
VLTAATPALRAGRLSAVQAIAAGQAPRAGRGYAAHRLASKLALPRPVSFGLAAPFTRPARSAATLAAVTSGLTAVVLAAGLDSSIAKINQGATQWQHAVLVAAGDQAGKQPPGSQAFTASQQRTAVAALRAQPGTLTYLAEASGTARVPGAGPQLPITAYSGDAAGLGWDITSGAWYTGPGQVAVNTARPGTGGLQVGQIIQMSVGGKQVTARVAGEVYAPSPVLGALLTSQQTLRDAGVSLPITRFEAALKPGISQQSYSAALQRALGPGLNVNAISTGVTTGPGHSVHGVGWFALVDTSLIRLLTIMVALLAGLGVLNTVLMLTRERVHDLGIFKAVGMTPGQAITMVTCWVIVPALAAVVIALPAGMALQDAVIHAIGSDQSALSSAAVAASQTPGSVIHVYTATGLIQLALAGLAIAITGALGPATWAAASKTTTALRAE